MAERGRTSSARITRWDVMVTNLKPSVPEMPHVADDIGVLEGLTAKGRFLATRQADLQSQVRTITAELAETMTEGDLVRSRLGAAVKAKFGFTDVVLTKYGIKPINRVPHKKKGSPTPTPTGTEASAGTAKAGTSPTEPTSPTSATSPTSSASPASSTSPAAPPK